MKNNDELLYQENYYTKLSSRLHDLSKAEQRAASYIMEHGPACSRMSVAQLAEAAGCSGASVIRLCKDLGYSGYAEMRFNIQQSTANPSDQRLSILESDSTEAVVEKAFRFTQQSLNSVLHLLDMETLERASRMIANARQVLLCSMGSACGAALAGANHLLSAGINATFQSDDLLIMRTVSYFGPEDVVIGINYDGNSKTVVDALMVAKRNKAATILITSMTKSLGTKYADAVLLTPKRNVNSSLNYSTTTICQILLVHLLLANAWQQTGTRLEAKTHEMRSLTHIKRYAADVEKLDVKPMKQ